MVVREGTKVRNTILISALGILSLSVFIYSLALLFDSYGNSSGQNMSSEDCLLMMKLTSGDDSETIEAQQFMEKLKPLSPLLNLIRNYEVELQEEYNAMKSNLANYDMESILSESVDNPESLPASALRLHQVRIKLGEHRYKFQEISRNTARKLKSLVIIELGNRASLDTIYNLIINGDFNINEYFSIQESIIDLVSKLQNFLTDKKGMYKMVGEEIKFRKLKDKEIFTNFGNKLLELWQKEKEWLIRIKYQEGIVDEQIHIEIENCL